MKRILVEKRGRGRLKGEGKERGAVQTFIKRRGGRRFMVRMYREFKSAEAIADHIYHRYNFYCCGNTVRNILRRYHMPLNPSGGDRRSSAQKHFRQTRGRNLA